jgi:uncharacterized small protein (DUF1192 family)
MFEEEKPKKKPAIHEVGVELGALSVDELRGRVAQLQDEIVRLEQAIAAKGTARNAADAFFKR